MRTRQEIFDIAWTGLKSQGFVRSYDRGCKYRGPNGLRCAIGWCIPDEAYSVELEGQGADSSSVLAAAGMLDDDWDFADPLQDCHDRAYGPVDMERRLRRFAREHDLTIPGERG